MSIVTFPHAGDRQPSAITLHPARDFAVGWFQATPAALLLPPVATFLAAWLQATPVAIALRTLSR